jgi:hypothetical protein
LFPLGHHPHLLHIFQPKIEWRNSPNDHLSGIFGNRHGIKGNQRKYTQDNGLKLKGFLTKINSSVYKLGPSGSG